MGISKIGSTSVRELLDGLLTELEYSAVGKLPDHYLAHKTELQERVSKMKSVQEQFAEEIQSGERCEHFERFPERCADCLQKRVEELEGKLRRIHEITKDEDE